MDYFVFEYKLLSVSINTVICKSLIETESESSKVTYYLRFQLIEQQF